ncbi:MAG TPA: hypothetical protein VGX78_07230 [Pirellulales bacterium]|jgi:hypothetical protein|nr:hypothetical protein [Pirellulales bacterium]
MIAWLWQFILQPLGLGGVKGQALASHVGAVPTLSVSVGANPRDTAAVSAAATGAGAVHTFP